MFFIFCVPSSVAFCNELFNKEQLFAHRPTHKLEDHLLSVVHRCLFNISQLPSTCGGRNIDFVREHRAEENIRN